MTENRIDRSRRVVFIRLLESIAETIAQAADDLHQIERDEDPEYREIEMPGSPNEDDDSEYCGIEGCDAVTGISSMWCPAHRDEDPQDSLISGGHGDDIPFPMPRHGNVCRGCLGGSGKPPVPDIEWRVKVGDAPDAIAFRTLCFRCLCDFAGTRRIVGWREHPAGPIRTVKCHECGRPSPIVRAVDPEDGGHPWFFCDVCEAARAATLETYVDDPVADIAAGKAAAKPGGWFVTQRLRKYGKTEEAQRSADAMAGAPTLDQARRTIDAAVQGGPVRDHELDEARMVVAASVEDPLACDGGPNCIYADPDHVTKPVADISTSCGPPLTAVMLLEAKRILDEAGGYRQSIPIEELARGPLTESLASPFEVPNRVDGTSRIEGGLGYVVPAVYREPEPPPRLNIARCRMCRLLKIGIEEGSICPDCAPHIEPEGQPIPADARFDREAAQAFLELARHVEDPGDSLIGNAAPDEFDQA